METANKSEVTITTTTESKIFSCEGLVFIDVVKGYDKTKIKRFVIDIPTATIKEYNRTCSECGK